MNKRDFLNELDRQLGNISENDRADILYDYEEHFRMGLAEGKNEEEISAALGDARNIARQYKADCALRKAESNISTGNILRAVLSAGVLGFFNLVIVLGPFLGLIGVLIGLFAAAFSITLSGIALFIAAILSPFLPGLIDIGTSFIFGTSLSVGLTCLGLLFLIGVCFIAKYFYRLTIAYLKWNLDFIKR